LRRNGPCQSIFVPTQLLQSRQTAQCDGTVPVKRLSDKSKYDRAIRAPNCDGMIPVKELYDRPNSIRAGTVPNGDGSDGRCRHRGTIIRRRNAANRDKKRNHDKKESKHSKRDRRHSRNRTYNPRSPSPPPTSSSSLMPPPPYGGSDDGLPRRSRSINIHLFLRLVVPNRIEREVVAHAGLTTAGPVRSFC
jgi:hypothetical protein